MSDKRTAEEGRFAGLALAEEELVARVAWCYYHDGLTQNDIGERLGLPRLKISRLLAKGRQSGVIRVQINSRYEGCLALETELQQRFGLKLVRVMPALNTPPMNVRLGIGAAQSLMGVLEPGQLLAVGFGETTMSSLQHLSGFISSQQIRLVTLSGGVGPYMTGIGQLDAACSVSMIPAPLRVSSAEVAGILKRETSVRDVILAATAADVAVVGIGSVNQRRDATILRSGYISEGEQLMYARKGAVGDILGYFLNAEGECVEELEIHKELLGVQLAELAQLPTIVGVAGGEEKADAIYAALKGRRINGLGRKRRQPARCWLWPDKSSPALTARQAHELPFSVRCRDRQRSRRDFRFTGQPDCRWPGRVEAPERGERAGLDGVRPRHQLAAGLSVYSAGAGARTA